MVNRNIFDRNYNDNRICFEFGPRDLEKEQKSNKKNGKID